MQTEAYFVEIVKLRKWNLIITLIRFNVPNLLYIVTPVACYKIPQVSLLHFFWLSCTKDKFMKGQSPLFFSSLSLFTIFHGLIVSIHSNFVICSV